MHTKMSICAPNCCSWQTAAPAAKGKKGRHLRFLPSLNTRFPWQPTLGADSRLRKQEKGNGSRSTAQSLSPPFRNSQTAYCYTCGLINAECGITVPHNFLRVIPEGTCEFRYWVQFILVGAVRNLQTNELRNTGMLRLLEIADLCSRTVSGTANMSSNGRAMRPYKEGKPTVVLLFLLTQSTICTQAMITRETGVQRG